MTAILAGAGLPPEDAKLTADALLDAEASGVESHGVTRLAAYVDRIANGSIAASPKIAIKENGAVLHTDGGNGLGQVAMDRTVDACIRIARKYGVAVATVCNSNHFGAAAYYTNRLAKAGFIGFAATNAGATMAPYGGMDLLLGTNPFSVSFPAKNQIFCGDLATSSVAKGKIRIYEKEGKAIPSGWALDKEGNETQDPREAIKGILLPMGGHKGYALAMAVDAVCGLLSGAYLSCEAPSMFCTEIPANVGHFVFAADIAHFLPVEEFEERAQEWFEKIKTSRPRPGGRIMIPGEPEAAKRESSGGKLSILAETMEMVELYYLKYAAAGNRVK